MSRFNAAIVSLDRFDGEFARAPMPAVAPGRSILKISFGFSLAGVAILVGAVFLSGAPAFAATAYTLTGICLPAANCQWNDTTKWTPNTGYPGSAAGDTASMPGGTKVSVNVGVANGVILSMPIAGTAVDVPAGSLQLEASSNLGSGGNIITVNGGNLTLNNVGTFLGGGSYAITMNSGTMQTNGTVNITSALNIAGGTLTNSGTLNMTGGGTLTLSNGTLINNLTVDIQSGSPTNTFTWSGGTLDGTGVTQVGGAPAATLQISGPVTMNGTGTLNATTPNFSLSNSVSTTSGTPRIINLGTMTDNAISATIQPEFDNQGTVTFAVSAQTLSLLGGGTHFGTWNFPSPGDALSLNGAHTFSAVTWTAPSGATLHVLGGTTTLNVALTVSDFIQDAGIFNGSSILTVNNTFQWTGGTQGGTAPSTILTSSCTATLNGGNDTIIDNGRTLGVQGTLNYAPTGVATLNINNGSQLSLSGASAILNLQNDAQIKTNNIATSRLRMLGLARIQKSGGSVSQIGVPIAMSAGDSIVPGANTKISLTAGTIPTLSIGNSTLNASALNSVIEFAGGTFDLSTPNLLTVSPGAGALKLTNNAVIRVAAGTFTLPIHFIQDGTSTILGNGPGNVSTSAVYDWNGGTLDTFGASGLNIAPAGVLNINGNSAMTMTNFTKIVNFGTINFNPATFPLAVNSNSAIVNNGGAANINLQNSNGLGIITDGVDAGGFLKVDVNNGFLTKSAGGTIPIAIAFNNNGGAVSVNAGTLQLLNGGTSGSTLNIAAGANLEIKGGPTYTIAGTVAGAGVTLLTSGGLTVAATMPIPNFTETGGTLSVGLNFVTITGNMIFNGGTILGGVGGVVASSSSLTIGGVAGTTLDGGVGLLVQGTGQYNGTLANFLTLKNASYLGVNNSPAGQLTVNNPTLIASDATGTQVNNGGIFTMAGAGALQVNTNWVQAGPPGAPSAIFNINAGATVNLTKGGQSNGPFNVAGNLNFTGGLFGMSVGSTLTGSGTYAVPTGGTLAINTAMNVPTNFNLSGGTLTGDASFTASAGSTFTWTGGTMTSFSGSGATDISGGTLVMNSTTGGLTLDNRSLNINSGSATWQAGGNPFAIVNGGLLAIGALFDIRAGASNISGNGLIHIVPGGTLQKSILGSTLLVFPDLRNDGILSILTGAMALESTASVTHTGGNFNVGAAGAGFSFANGTHTLSPGTTFTGPGTFFVDGSTLTNSTGGTVSIPNLKLITGTMTGNPFATTTLFNFDAGNLNAPMSSSGTITFTGLNGAMNLSATLTIQSGAVATYNAASNPLKVNYPGGSIVNNGTFTLATAQPITLVGAPPAGTYLFTNNAGATLNGNGVINVAVTNDGNLNPGTSPGTITINNAYTQTANGVLNIDLNGTTAGTQYDQLIVNGTVTLAGTLNAILGYTPTNGDTYNVLSFTSRTADFTTKNLPPFPPGGQIQASYSPTVLQLLAVAPSADIGITKTLVGTLVAGSPVTYTITVQNFGPDPATAIQISDPTPVGLTVSSISGACTAFPCTIASLTASSSATITAVYSLPSNASGSVTNIATITSSTPLDPTAANNSATVTTAISQKADIVVTKSGPATANPGSNAVYNITVTNGGPSDAVAVTLSDTYTPVGRLSFVSATGACAAFPCALGNMVSGQTKTVQATYLVVPGPSVAIVNTASATASSPADPNGANNSASVTSSTGCPTSAPGGLSPADGATNVSTNGTFSWSNVNASGYTIYLDVVGPGGSCSKFFAATGVTTAQFFGLQPGTTYQWRVEATTSGCQSLSSSCIKFTTASNCPTTPPTLTLPISGSVNGTTTYSWSSVPGAIDYKLFVNGTLVTTTTATSFGPVTVGNGPVSWFVVAEFGGGCPALQSAIASFNGCNTADPPLPSLVAQAASGEGYDLTFTNVPGQTGAIVDESTDLNFAAGSTTSQTVTTNTVHFQHLVTSAKGFYYRVRAILPCGTTINSLVVRVVLAPFTPPTNPNVSVPSGNKARVAIIVHVPGFPGQTLPFTASLDPKPWLLSVEPTSGDLPPEGKDFTVFVDPSILPNGTFTGTLILSVTTPNSGGIANNGVTPVTVPVSISLVTPITPTTSSTPPANAVIVPSAGHLDGINSHWQSDVFVSNTTAQSTKYQLTFTPDDVSLGVKRTLIDVGAGATTALVDIVKTWYGVGSLGESANGVIEIRPFAPSGKGTPSNDDVSVSFTGIASSRAYNVSSTSNATLGQFIPALPFSGFVGKALDNAHAATVLGLQQIAQNNDYRSNIGVLEASGQPVSVLVSAFDGNGNKLLDFPLDLRGGEQRQLNSFLAQNRITLDTGRIEVKVLSGDGKIAAYASVVDNKSGDPFLVSGVPLGQNAFNHFVLPGAADLNTGAASWRTDMQILNPTTSAQTVELTFQPQNGGGGPRTTSMMINAGELKRIDNIVSSLFGVTNTGGAVHVTTATATPLVVTGRTFDLTSNGTFGQFVPAVTEADAVGGGGGTLHILQAEDSVRYRMNLGVAEVTGKPATVEVQVILPDSKISPSTQIPIPANGFLQIPVIQSLGLSNIYNAHVTVKVVGGDGKVSAYGSVIDQITQAPTYIPAQK